MPPYEPFNVYFIRIFKIIIKYRNVLFHLEFWRISVQYILRPSSKQEKTKYRSWATRHYWTLAEYCTRSRKTYYSTKRESTCKNFLLLLLFVDTRVGQYVCDYLTKRGVVTKNHLKISTQSILSSIHFVSHLSNFSTPSKNKIT